MDGDVAKRRSGGKHSRNTHTRQHAARRHHALAPHTHTHTLTRVPAWRAPALPHTLNRFNV